MRKLVKRMDSISLRMLLSYFSILLVPLCVIAVIYASTMSAILAYRRDSMQSALRETAHIVSTRLQEINNISLYIYSNNAVNAVINRSRADGSRSIYAIHEAVGTLPSYKLINQLVADVFIFFNEAAFVIKQPSAFAFTRYSYDQQVRFSGISYEEMEALCHQGFAGVLHVRNGGAGREALLLRSIPNSSDPRALIAIQIHTGAIDELMRAYDMGPGGGAYIFTDGGEMLSGSADAPFERETLLALMDDESYVRREIAHEGETYLLCQVREGGLTYLTLTNRAYLLVSVAPMRVLLSVLSMAAVAFGSLASIALWRRRRKVVRSVQAAALGAGVTVLPAKSEAHLLEYTVSTLASTVGSLREMMEAQHQALAQAVVQGCLSGTFSSREEMMREVAALPLPLAAPCYYVVRVLLLSPWETLTEDARVLPYRMFLKQFFKERLGIPHVCVDLGGASFALLLTAPERFESATLAGVFRALSDEIARLDWEVPSFAISGGCEDLFDVSALLADTGEIVGYMALLALRGVFLSEDLPKRQDAAFFPMELELRLAQTMESGAVQAFEALFDEIIDENTKKRVLDAATLRGLFEALRRCILRTIQEAGAEAGAEDQREALSRVRTFSGLRAYAVLVKERMFKATAVQTREETQKTKETLRRMIDEMLPDPLFTLSMLSEAAGIPESTLYRGFKELFGVSFASYLEQRRIHMAFELLKDQVMIKDVAERVGYTSDHTFRRAFKRVMKVPPSQFAALIKG